MVLNQMRQDQDRAAAAQPSVPAGRWPALKEATPLPGSAAARQIIGLEPVGLRTRRRLIAKAAISCRPSNIAARRAVFLADQPCCGGGRTSVAVTHEYASWQCGGCTVGDHRPHCRYCYRPQCQHGAKQSIEQQMRQQECSRRRNGAASTRPWHVRLVWLAAQQQPNGSFPTLDTGQPGVTCLCMLAFMSHGHLPGEGPYGEHLKRAGEYAAQLPETKWSGHANWSGRSANIARNSPRYRLDVRVQPRDLLVDVKRIIRGHSANRLRTSQKCDLAGLAGNSRNACAGRRIDPSIWAAGDTSIIGTTKIPIYRSQAGS